MTFSFLIRSTHKLPRILTALTLFCWLAAFSSISCADLLGLDDSNHQVVRLDPSTGATLGKFADLTSMVQDYAFDMTFGPDNNLYVTDWEGLRILRYDGKSGAFLDTYATTNSHPQSLTFDATGNLYVSTGSTIEKFAAGTAAPLGDLFTETNDEYYRQARIGPDGLLYALHYHGSTRDLVRYSPETGAVIDTYVSGRIYDGPSSFAFDSDGGVFVADWNITELFHYEGTTPTSIDSLTPLLPLLLDQNFDVLTYAPDGSLLFENIAGSIPDWYVQKYDPTTGALLANFPKANYTSLIFTPAVPEPSAGLLLLLGFLHAPLRRQRMR